MDHAALAAVFFALVERHGGSVDVGPHYNEDAGPIRLILQFAGVTVEVGGATIVATVAEAQAQLDQLRAILRGEATE